MKIAASATIPPVSERAFAAVAPPDDASTPMLRFRDLRNAFGGQTVLDGISGEIRPGEVILLRGENGSGKTTLLNILSGCLEPDRGSIEITQPSGIGYERFEFPRAWHRDLNPFRRFTPERMARLGIGRMWQDIRLFGTLDLADNIAAATAAAPDSPWEALFRPAKTRRADLESRQSASAALSALGLSDRDTCSAGMISLGQSKRVAIARALRAGARLLFSTNRSPDSMPPAFEMILHLRQLAQEHHVALLIVEHILNIPHVLEIASTVWTLKRGRLNSKSVEPSTDSTEDLRAIIQRGLGPTAACIQTDLGDGATLTTWPTGASPVTSQPICEVSDLTIARGARILFDNEARNDAGLSFTIRPDSINLIEAPNGWGKTSVLACIAGLIAPARGRVRLFRRDSAAKSVWKRHRCGLRAMVSSGRVFPSLSVMEHHKLARPDGRRYSQTEADARPVAALSGGEHQRLRLRLHNSSGWRLSLLDEPLESLDMSDDIDLKTIFDCPPGCAVLISIPASQHQLPTRITHS